MTKNNYRPGLNTIHSDFFKIKELVYDQCGFNCSSPQAETESAEYGACSFILNGLSVKFRVAKTTPVKAGQFVTLWKRNGLGPIEPFDLADEIDLFVISTGSENNFGQFVFPKAVLLSKGILSGDGKKGKLAIRIYPPREIVTSKQAKKTQQWQSAFFLQISADNTISIAGTKKLYQY
jgi:hypothetical protein